MFYLKRGFQFVDQRVASLAPVPRKGETGLAGATRAGNRMSGWSLLSGKHTAHRRRHCQGSADEVRIRHAHAQIRLSGRHLGGGDVPSEELHMN